MANATDVRCLYYLSGVLYAGTSPNGDVFKYDVGTDTWANTGNLAGAERVLSLCELSGVLYAGTYPNGNVFKYNSGADTWANTGDLNGATHVQSLYYLSGVLYAGTQPNGDVFKYDVGTDTWTNTGNLAGAERVLSLCELSGVLYAGTFPNGNVFKYNAGADTWANTGDLDGATHVYVLHTRDGVLYAGTRPNGNVFKYNAGADTWTNTGDLSNAEHVYALHGMNGILYAGTQPNGKVFIYNADADTWANTNSLSNATYTYDLEDISGVLYAGTQPNGDVFVLEIDITKTSLIGIDVCIKEVPRVSSIGLTVVDNITKESSIGICVYGDRIKESSICLDVRETLTKVSSIGLKVYVETVQTWLSGYSYRKLGAVNATTAGAQTLFQLELVVGESSGAAGCGVHCNNHCQNFPNDIRFTAEDGTTKHDYWIKNVEGTTPNRKATIVIEVASIPASGSVDFYMYYGQIEDSGESSFDNAMDWSGYGPGTELPDPNLLGWWKFDSVGDVHDYSENGNSAVAGLEEYFDDISNFTNGLPSESDQGVAVDSNYIYVIGSYYPDQGMWNCTVLRYNLSDFSYVDAHDLLCYDEPTQTFSDGAIINGKLYVTQRAHGIGNICADNKVSVYDVNDFSLLEHHDVTSGSPYCLESIDGHDGFFWLMYGCSGNGCNAKIEKYNSSWALVDTFYLGDVPAFGYQGITWVGDQIFVNHHNSGVSLKVLDIYDWNGTSFTYNRTVNPPPICNQGLAYYDNKIYWASRRPTPQNGKVYITETTTHFVGSAEFVTGKYRKGISYNGVDDYVSIPGFKPALSGDFTIDLWVKFNSYNDYQCPITTMDNNSAHHGFWLEFGSARGFTIYNTGVEKILEDNIQDLRGLNTGQWYFIMVVREGSGTNNLKLYVDNVLAGQDTFTGTVGDPTQSLLIGKLSHAATTHYLHGIVDELQFYDRALVSDERTTHFETRKYAAPEPTWSTWGVEEAPLSGKLSSIGLTVTGVEEETKVSSIGLKVCVETQYEAILKKGLFYAKLGDTILTGVTPENFRITKEIDKIPTFEFEIANTDENRTAIANEIDSTFKVYWQHHAEDRHVFTGIINADGIEYISLDSIFITGYASYVKLAWPFHKHLADEDKELTDVVLKYSSGYFTNYTTQANNDTINDVNVNFDGVNNALYIGSRQPFWGLQIKYSTKGVRPGGCVIKLEYSKGNGVWETLDALDESNAFTEDPGTYDLIIPHPPADWARNTDGYIKKYWIRFRIDSGSYSVSPRLDRIYTVNVDIYRSYYFNTSAQEILLNVLAGTEYTMDEIDYCPNDIISIVAEYESPLRIIAGIAKALTWTTGDEKKKAYQWWIDDQKKVHMKTQRGTAYDDDITGDMTIFNNQEDYFHLSNRLHGLGPRDGLSQIRSIVENKASITTHGLREIAVSKENVGKYLMLRNALEKDIAISKEPMQRIKGSVSTQFWGLQGYDIGDTITLHQAAWNVAETPMQIVKVEMGPLRTTLNLGISQEHLDGLKNDMQRQLNFGNIQMHGSTTMFQAGPERMNYQRVSTTEVHPAKLDIKIPSEVRKIHKVHVSWTVGPYRADVGPVTKTGGGHTHGGTAGSGGAFTPGIAEGGGFVPVVTGGQHFHQYLPFEGMDIGFANVKILTSNSVSGLQHRHTGGGTGYPNSQGSAYALLDEIDWGSECTEGACIDAFYSDYFATDEHYHQNSDTGYTTPAGTVTTENKPIITKFQPTALPPSTTVELPAHLHDAETQGEHPHTGVEYLGHEDHDIEPEEDFTLSINYDIHEEPPGTTLELLVNGEKIGEYTTPQSEIRIDGYLNTGNNVVELQPIVGENKKGGANISSSGLLFVEPQKF